LLTGEAKGITCAVKRDVTISIRVSTEQKEQLDRIAKSERRPVSQLAYLLVEEGLQRREEASKPSGKA
jgi:predicted transcriptional regulator